MQVPPGDSARGKTDSPAPPAGLRIGPNARISNRAGIVLETPVRIDGQVGMRNGFIGAYTGIGRDSRIGPWTISLGRYCTIGPGVVIGDGEHPLHWLSTHPFQKAEPVWFGGNVPKAFRHPRYPPPPRSLIGNDVWIGASAILLANTHVGDGAIIEAGSVVTRNVPPYAVVAGIPARIVGYRFPPETIQALQALGWWRFPAWALSGVPFDDIDAAIAEITRREAAGELTEATPALVRFSGKTCTPVRSRWETSRIRARYRLACRRSAAVRAPERAPVPDEPGAPASVRPGHGRLETHSQRLMRLPADMARPILEKFARPRIDAGPIPAHSPTQTADGGSTTAADKD